MTLVDFAGFDAIVLTGPESTGKTTLATKLAERWSLPLVEEFSRTHLEANGPNYTYEDLCWMAKQQSLTEELAQQNSNLIICDTDWITIEIWSQVVFGKSIQHKPNQLKKFYFLCPPDIPWEPDPLRENPDNRNELFLKYERFLLDQDLPFSILDRAAEWLT